MRKLSKHTLHSKTKPRQQESEATTTQHCGGQLAQCQAKLSTKPPLQNHRYSNRECSPQKLKTILLKQQYTTLTAKLEQNSDPSYLFNCAHLKLEELVDIFSLQKANTIMK